MPRLKEIIHTFQKHANLKVFSSFPLKQNQQSIRYFPSLEESHPKMNYFNTVSDFILISWELSEKLYLTFFPLFTLWPLAKTKTTEEWLKPQQNKHHRYERIWFKTLHVMSNVKVPSIQDGWSAKKHDWSWRSISYLHGKKIITWNVTVVSNYWAYILWPPYITIIIINISTKHYSQSSWNLLKYALLPAS